MLIRYPGSKDQHVKFLSRHILPLAEQTKKIAEPFSGTASITFSLLASNSVQSYWINDLDPAIVSLWKTVKENPDGLISLIEEYVPNVEDFYAFKVSPGDDDITRAFRKVVMHQVSYSGLGAMAGGPLGGKKQAGKYLIDCRWRPHLLEKRIQRCSKLLNSVEGKFTNLSFEKMLPQAFREEYFVYLDPPYFDAGNALYTHKVSNHQKLANLLQSNKNWILSYDDTTSVRDMYSWANIEPLAVRSHLHHRSITDVVISAPSQESFAW